MQKIIDIASTEQTFIITVRIMFCCSLMDAIEFRGGKDKGGPALQTSWNGKYIDFSLLNV